MNNNNTTAEKCHFTPRAVLLALGVKVKQQGILKTISEHLKIKQKTVKDSPLDKITDALVTILAGGKGLVEANQRVRSDRALQLAFGRERCAEQSVISQTLDACNAENVSQMETAMRQIYQNHSQAYGHDYHQWQLLDIDLSGQPCGKKAAFASKGYFAHQRNRRGRQLGRVWASWYKEIVVDQLYPGNITLATVLIRLIDQAETVLELNDWQRQRTILRLDGHGGSQADVNELLRRGYHLHTKEYSGSRARTLAESVTTWHKDPRVPGRYVGWVTLAATEYTRPLTRIAVRTRKKNGQWGIGVILSSLSSQQVALLAGLTPEQWHKPLDQLFAYVYFYDLRAGGIETGFKDDKQALGITKRNKKRFEAQQMLTQLNALAHNLLTWFQLWLAQRHAAVAKLGLVRLLRDVLTINGSVFLTMPTRFPPLSSTSMIVSPPTWLSLSNLYFNLGISSLFWTKLR